MTPGKEARGWAGQKSRSSSELPVDSSDPETPVLGYLVLWEELRERTMHSLDAVGVHFLDTSSTEGILSPSISEHYYYLTLEEELAQEDVCPPQHHICRDTEVTSKMCTADQSSEVVKDKQDDHFRRTQARHPNSAGGTARQLNLTTHYCFF